MTANSLNKVTVCRPAVSEIPRIADFLCKARAKMFPFLDEGAQNRVAEDMLANFRAQYLDHEKGAFFTARIDGVLIGTIGYVAYDGRFPQLRLEPKTTVEVVKLYIEPVWRRSGLGSKLFEAVSNQARSVGIEQLYLHTHPFLPGAITFWEHLGFTVIGVDDDDTLWHTTHMSQSLL